MVKVDENLSLGDLCDVVHALARIVADTGIWVAEARKNWRHNFFKIASDFLQ